MRISGAHARFAALVAALFVVGAIAGIVLGSQPPSPESADVPEDVMSSIAKVGDCVETLDRLVQPPTEPELTNARPNEWLREGAAFLGGLPEAAQAFRGTIVHRGELIAWIKVGSEARRLVAFDTSRGIVWIETGTIRSTPCR